LQPKGGIVKPQFFLSTASAKYNSAIFGLALLAVILVFLPTSRYGAGLSPDSVGYIATARNVMTGAGFTTYDGTPLVVHAPLFSALLALAGKLFNTDPLVLANIVNAFIFGLIVYVGGILVFRYLSSTPIIALMGTLTILASIPLFKVSVMAYSEPLFILFVLLSLLFANSYLERNDVLSLVLFSLSIAFATLTRYVGIVLLPWGISIILIFYHNGLKNRIMHISVFLCLAALPIGLWLLRNYVVANTFLGPHGPSSYTLSQNLTYVFNVLISWYVPAIIADNRFTLILLGMAIGFLAGLHPKQSWQSLRVRWRQLVPLVLLVCIFMAFLVISSTTTAYDKLDNRLLSPVYVPFTIVLLILAQALVEPHGRLFSNRAVISLPAIAFAIWLLIYPLRITAMNARNVAPDGLGYASKAWIQSQTVQYVVSHPTLTSGCTVYSNDPYATYILAHLNTKMSPAKFHSLQDSGNDISRLGKTWPVENNKVCMLWFENSYQKQLFTIDELQTVATLDLIARFDDGAIYSVTRK
jgi:hypothetical protein